MSSPNHTSASRNQTGLGQPGGTMPSSRYWSLPPIEPAPFEIHPIERNGQTAAARPDATGPI